MSTLFGLVLVEFTRTVYIVSCNSASAATWLLYDYVYSLEDEITLIWRSADTLPKFLYFISRYFGLFVQLCVTLRIVPLYCQPALIFDVICFTVLTFSVEISLMLRVYALYGKTRTTLVILCVSFSGEILALAIINGLSYADFFDDIKPYPADWPIKACYYPYTPTIYNFSWTPILVFETVLFVLISVKCFAYRPLHEIPILQRVWRDGIIYYCVITAALATVTISAGIRNHLVAEVSATWISAVLSFSGAHLLLSLRALAAARDGAEVLTPMISGDIPDIVVESPSAPASPIDEHSPLSSPVDRHELLPHAHRALHSHNQVMPTTAIRRYSGSVVQWIRSRMYELMRPVN